MASRKKKSSKPSAAEVQRKIVESYIEEHKLEDIMNTVLNQCVKERPADPFVMLADLLKEHSSTAIGITSLVAREIFDSQGQPAVEVTVETQQGSFTASSSAGVTQPRGPACLELRDGDEARYDGMGVQNAVKMVNEVIAPVLVGRAPQDQAGIDQALVDVDGTGNFSKIGANAALAVSMACCRAGAREKNVPLYRHLAELAQLPDICLPVPVFTLVSGGNKSESRLCFRDFSIMPVGLSSFADALQAGIQINKVVRAKAREQFGWQTTAGCGPEGQLLLPLETTEEVIDLLVAAIEGAGYKIDDVKLAITVAANDFVVPKTNGDEEAEAKATEAAAAAAEAAANEKQADEDEDADGEGEAGAEPPAPIRDYNMTFKTAPHDAKDARIVNGEELAEEYRTLCEKYPDLIVSLEDPFERSDTQSFARLTEELGENVQIAGDELLCGHAPSILQAAAKLTCNAIVVRPAEIGTVSDTVRTCKMAQESGWGIVLNASRGETCDSFLADIAVATSAGQLKAGAPLRGDRTGKFNRLLRVAEECELAGSDASYAGRRFRFPTS